MNKCTLGIFMFLLTFAASAQPYEYSTKRINSQIWKNLSSINAWDMTCKELQDRINSLEEEGLPPVIRVKQSLPSHDEENLLAVRFNDCHRLSPSLTSDYRPYRIRTANRFCNVKRCAVEIGRR